jgi:hypothetical protein
MIRSLRLVAGRNVSAKTLALTAGEKRLHIAVAGDADHHALAELGVEHPLTRLIAGQHLSSPDKLISY